MKHILIIPVLFLSFSLTAQIENKNIRRGNKLYEKNEYSIAESEYQKALKIDSTSFIAKYNFADAQYKQKNYKNSLDKLEKLSQKTKNEDTLSRVYYNIANNYVKLAEDTLKMQSLEPAINYLEKALDNYKASIKLNPDDKEAKFNYLVVEKILEQLKQQQQQQNQQNQNDKNNQDKNQQENQDQNQQNKNEKNQEQQNEKDNKQQNDDKNDQNKEEGEVYAIPYDEMMRMLNAVMQNDKNTYEKAQEKIQKNVKANTKNW